MNGMGRIRKIDIHTHIIPQKWPDWNKEFGYDGWLTIRHDSEGAFLLKSDGTIFRRVEQNCWCPETRISECDQHGVDIQVLSTVPGIGFNYCVPPTDALKVAKFLNDDIANTVKNGKGRFIGLGTVPLQDCQLAIQELHRCLDLGLVGLEIGSHVNGKSFDDQYFEPFWDEAERLNCPIFIHPWDMAEEERSQKYWFPWLLGMPHETALSMGSILMGGVLERHPRLRLCFAHGGGCFPALIGRIQHGFHARPDLCQKQCKIDPKDLLRKVWVDGLVHDEVMLKLLLEKVGSEKVMMGSDYPFPLGEIDRPGQLIERSIFSDNSKDDHALKEKLLWHNAAEFLNLNL